MYVADLEGTKLFFTRYFGASANKLYHNRKTGFKSYFLTFDGEARLEIMTLRYSYAHVSFSVGSREAVDALTSRLRNDGYEVTDGPRTTGDGYYESCVRGPEGCLVEITV